jgi:hypothetical protein
MEQTVVDQRAEPPSVHSQIPPSSQQIEVALRKIFRSPSFSSSRQGQQLLEYLVKKSQGGDEESLKERVIGVEVFNRRPDYSTGDDPIVRARVGEVRKRLAQYYQSERSQEDAVRFVIPSGSYKVNFEPSNEEMPPEIVLPEAELNSQSNASVEQDIVSAPAVSRKIFWRVLLAALFAALSIAATLTFLVQRQSATIGLSQFWSPYIHSAKPTIIHSGTNGVYVPTKEYRASHAQAGQELDDSVPALGPGEVLTSKDVYSDTFEFTTIGEVNADARLASLLTKFHHEFSIRTGKNISITDLRSSPSILVGAYNNFWSIELMRDLPYVFAMDGYIRESGGQGNQWTTHPGADGRNEDYAIVARLRDAQTGNPIVIVAGITSAGTRAAAEFVTNSNEMNKLNANAPTGWEKKNLEVVLQTTVFKGDPDEATVVAAHFW